MSRESRSPWRTRVGICGGGTHGGEIAGRGTRCEDVRGESGLFVVLCKWEGQALLGGQGS